MVRVLFLGGLGRSGTTLLERLLGQLPGVSPLGEVVHLWQRDLSDDERCGCGDRFSACGFWQKVGVEAFGGWDAVDPQRVLDLAAAVERTRHIPRLALGRKPEGLAEYADYYSKVYTAAAAGHRRHGGGRLVQAQRAGLLPAARADVDLRVIHVVRDSRGRRLLVDEEGAPPGDRDRRADDPLLPRAARRCCGTRTTRRSGCSAASACRCGGCGTRNCSADPKATLRSLARFAGLRRVRLRNCPFCGRPTTASSPISAPRTAPPATRCGSPSARVPLRRDEAWRRSLPKGQRRLVGALTAPLLSAYGYPLLGGARERA